MSENPGPAGTSGPRPGDEQRTAPVDTGPGPAEEDVNRDGTPSDEDEPDEG